MQASLAIWRAFLPPWTGPTQCSEAKESSQTPFDMPAAKAEPVSEPQPAPAMDLKSLPLLDTKPELLEVAPKVKPVSEVRPKQKPVTGKAAAKASPKKK